MKRKRILKILKFKGDEGLNLTRLSNGYEAYAANARQIAGIFIMAYLQTPMKHAQVATASRASGPYPLAMCAAQKTHKIYRERRFKIYKIFSEQRVNFSRRRKEA